MNAFLSKFMMYFELKRMDRDGRSIFKISEALNCNRRTVKMYLKMQDQEFESYLKAQSIRGKLLMPYETFVRDRLETYRDIPAAQMHGWLKEYHQDFPVVNQKMVFNFVKWVRHKYNMRYEPAIRDYVVLQETSYGLQAQVDLSPDQHTRPIFKQILSGCFSVVTGLGSIRNKISDAHGISETRVRPSARHAGFAVNLSGAVCQFLLDTFRETNK